MSRVRQFGRHLRDQIDWQDEAFYQEAMQMYADAINEAAHGWFPRSLRAWLWEFAGAIFIGAALMWLALLFTTGGFQP